MNPDEVPPPEPIPAHTPDQWPSPPSPSPSPPPAEDDRPAPPPVELPGQPHAPERVALRSQLRPGQAQGIE